MRLLLLPLLLASLSSLASAVTIHWSTVQTSSGVTTPANALGAPDGLSASIGNSGLLTASQFLQAVNYSDTALAAALNLSSLPLFNMILLEFYNTTSTAGGFAGSQFTFNDGGPLVSMQLNPGATVGIPNYVVAAGTIAPSAYAGIFGPTPAAVNVPYLLLNVPGINAGAANFQVSWNGFGGSTPDADAVGIVQGIGTPEPGSALLLVSALGALAWRSRRASSASTASTGSRHPESC